MAKVTMLKAREFVPRHLPLRELALPDDGVVHLWMLDLVALGSPLQPDEHIDPGAFTSRLQRTLRRFYLRLLLGAYLGIPGKDVAILRPRRGKPVLDADVHSTFIDFSVAASGGCCLIGISNSDEIGVDLELKDRQAGRPLALARRYFSNSETRALATLEDDTLDHAFLHTWACKEAVVKAAGHGIANRLCRFAVNVNPQEPPRILSMDDDDPAEWSLAVFRPGAGFIGAVAMRNGSLALEGFSLALAP